MMINDQTFAGVFYNERDLLAKINDLQAKGYPDEDMFVVVKDENVLSVVRGRTEVHVEATHVSFADRFRGFLSGESPVRDALTHMGLSEDQADQHYTEVENGGMLLYVDRSFAQRITDSSMATRDSVAANSSMYTESDDLAGAYPATDSDDTDRTNFTDTSRSRASLADEDAVAVDNTVYQETDDTAVHAGRPLDKAGTGAGTQDNTDFSDTETLRLHEERLNVNKNRVQTGEVQVEKEVIEEEARIDVPVEREEIHIERRPVTDQTMNTADKLTAFQEDDIRVPLSEERVEVTKKPVATEEIVVEKRTVQDTETVRDTVRREQASVDETKDRKNP